MCVCYDFLVGIVVFFDVVVVQLIQVQLLWCLLFVLIDVQVWYVVVQIGLVLGECECWVIGQYCVVQGGDVQCLGQGIVVYIQFECFVEYCDGGVGGGFWCSEVVGYVQIGMYCQFYFVVEYEVL